MIFDRVEVSPEKIVKNFRDKEVPGNAYVHQGLLSFKKEISELTRS